MAKAAGIEVHPVGDGRWDDLAALFEARGGPSYCWCMAWRATRDEAKRRDGPASRRMLRQRVRDGVPVGLLAYRDGEPVAWCSVAPKPTFPGLGDADHGVGLDRVWAITCFFIRRDLRGGPIRAALLDAAWRYAKAQGAKVVEGQPVDPGSPSYRHMGKVAWFLDAGFEEVERIGTRRHLVVRSVR
jgi:GNAT superfamily N-acetyltransferase